MGQLRSGDSPCVRENARRFSHPHAARTIVETLLTDETQPFTLDADQREAIAQAAAAM